MFEPSQKASDIGTTARLFTPFNLARLELPNRLAVAPMTRVSATDGGHATPRMGEYYTGFAEGGFGLLVTEGIYTDKAYSQGYLHQPGLADDAQLGAWRAVVARVHAAGGKIIAQLMHAGALSQGNPHRKLSAGPSVLTPKGTQLAIYRGSGPYRTPFAMAQADIDEAVAGFAAAAERAQAAGFDGVEVHGANGYLLDQFLTVGVNARLDAYGGPLQSRAKLVLQTLHAVRAATGPGFVVGVRISQGKVNDFEHRWAGAEDDARIVFGLLATKVDYIHTTEFEAWRPACSDEGLSLAALAKLHSRLPVIANGSLHDPVRAAAILTSGDADIVALGRGALAADDWPHQVREGRTPPPFDKASLQPVADLATFDGWRAASGTRRSGPGQARSKTRFAENPQSRIAP